MKNPPGGGFFWILLLCIYTLLCLVKKSNNKSWTFTEKFAKFLNCEYNLFAIYIVNIK